MRLIRPRLPIVIAICATCILAGCLPPRDHADLPAVSDGMTTWAKAQWPDATSAQLVHGRETMQGKCTQCHSMPAPTHESAKDWPGVMKSMAHKAKLGEDDEVAMLHYILAAREVTAGSGK